ncbi:MAG: DUF2752 domain-containing protein [Bacteroidota bacterium]|nr:DUF2752 domain-containing protein [Bacteroidota bacterium]
METLISFFEEHLFTCSIKSLIGLDCPGCGMQRAFIALLRGEIMESLELNASLLPFLFTIGFTICHLLFSFQNGSKYIVVFFSSTAAILVVNFVVKLILHS